MLVLLETAFARRAPWVSTEGMGALLTMVCSSRARSISFPAKQTQCGRHAALPRWGSAIIRKPWFRQWVAQMAGKNLSERFGCVTRLHLLGSALFTLAVATPVTAQEG